MRWKGRRESSNVEDRRGMSPGGKGMVGGGIGTIAIVLVVLLLGGDPTSILQNVQLHEHKDQHQTIQKLLRIKSYHNLFLLFLQRQKVCGTKSLKKKVQLIANQN
jgi:predicted metalloprotease